MKPSFCMIFRPGKALEFRSLDESTRSFFDAHPAIPNAVRAMSAVYRKELKSACTVIAIARDLESVLRIVTRTPGLTVTPMRYATISDATERKLVEITDDRLTLPAAR